MVLDFDPQPVPDDFEWRGDKFHLTYKGHHDKDIIMVTLSRATTVPLVGHSLVHETTFSEPYRNGDGELVSDDKYEHTHFGFIFKTRINLKGSRKFDIYDGSEQYHPNVLPKVTMASMEQLFLHYHRGRKYSIVTGKMEYTKPDFLDQKLPFNWDFTEQIIHEVVHAPSLGRACIAGGVRPRSVTDIRALRDDESEKKKPFVHQFDASTFHPFPVRAIRAVHVYGGTGLGKTKCALAQFKNPLLIKPFNSIGCLEAIMRKFHDGFHDGLVLDEADLTFLTREQVIAILDFDEECQLDVRFKSFTLPAGLPKIIISNPPPGTLYPKDDSGAIWRRLDIIHVTAPTYKTRPAPVPVGLMATAALTPGMATPPTQPSA